MREECVQYSSWEGCWAGQWGRPAAKKCCVENLGVSAAEISRIVPSILRGSGPLPPSPGCLSLGRHWQNVVVPRCPRLFPSSHSALALCPLLLAACPGDWHRQTGVMPWQRWLRSWLGMQSGGKSRAVWVVGVPCPVSTRLSPNAVGPRRCHTWHIPAVGIHHPSGDSLWGGCKAPGSQPCLGWE